MTRLFLIRHGETSDLETKKIYKGRLDVPLSERGRERIARVSSYLSDYPIQHVYTSTLSRAIESGTIIARPHGLEIKSTPALNEISFGSWEGLSFDEISEQYPNELDLWMKDPEVHSPPEGEPLPQAQKRIMESITSIHEAHEKDIVAIVAHGGMLRIAICSLLHVKLSNIFKIEQSHGCINIVDLHGNGNVTVQLLNFVAAPVGLNHCIGAVPRDPT